MFDLESSRDIFFIASSDSLAFSSGFTFYSVFAADSNNACGSFDLVEAG